MPPAWGPTEASGKEKKGTEVVEQTPPTVGEALTRVFGEFGQQAEQAGKWMQVRMDAVVDGLSTPRLATWSKRWYLLLLDVRTLAQTCPREIELLRLLTDSASLMARPLVPSDVQIKEVTVDGVRCLWQWPSAFTTPEQVPGKLLYIHGGAFCLGSPETHLQMTSQISRRSQLAVLSPDYRRCPEATLTQAQEDCIKVYRFLVEECVATINQTGDIPEKGSNAPPEKCRPGGGHVVIGGESAGASIALGMALQIVQGKLKLTQPKGLALMSPWVDLADSIERTSGSWQESAHLDFVLPDLAELFAKWVIVSEHHGGVAADSKGKEKFDAMDQDAVLKIAKSESVSPGLAKSFKGLPPTLVTIGQCETLRDSQLACVDRMRKDGVQVEKELYVDMCHAFGLCNFAAGGICESPSAVLDRFSAFARHRCELPALQTECVKKKACCSLQ